MSGFPAASVMTLPSTLRFIAVTPACAQVEPANVHRSVTAPPASTVTTFSPRRTEITLLPRITSAPVASKPTTVMLYWPRRKAPRCAPVVTPRLVGSMQAKSLGLSNSFATSTWMVEIPTWSQSSVPKVQLTSRGARTGSEQPPAAARTRQAAIEGTRVRIVSLPSLRLEPPFRDSLPEGPSGGPPGHVCAPGPGSSASVHQTSGGVKRFAAWCVDTGGPPCEGHGPGTGRWIGPRRGRNVGPRPEPELPGDGHPLGAGGGPGARDPRRRLAG